ncbi:MAG: BrxA/BrxB family bacilliredoxin [Gemmatimonadota bacterium]
MAYPEMMVRPMREELTRLGVQELKTPADVDAVFGHGEGTLLVFVNSVCGCAAAGARPALSLALDHAAKPAKIVSVFAGVDTEATQRARSFFSEYQPSSPSIAILKDGEVVHFVHRHMIEGRGPQQVAADLTAAFDKYCSTEPAAR